MTKNLKETEQKLQREISENAAKAEKIELLESRVAEQADCAELLEKEKAGLGFLQSQMRTLQDLQNVTQNSLDEQISTNEILEERIKDSLRQSESLEKELKVRDFTENWKKNLKLNFFSCFFFRR